MKKAINEKSAPWGNPRAHQPFPADEPARDAAPFAPSSAFPARLAKPSGDTDHRSEGLTEKHHQIDTWLRIIERCDSASRRALSKTSNSVVLTALADPLRRRIHIFQKDLEDSLRSPLATVDRLESAEGRDLLPHLARLDFLDRDPMWLMAIIYEQDQVDYNRRPAEPGEKLTLAGIRQAMDAFRRYCEIAEDSRLLHDAAFFSHLVKPFFWIGHLMTEDASRRYTDFMRKRMALVSDVVLRPELRWIYPCMMWRPPDPRIASAQRIGHMLPSRSFDGPMPAPADKYQDQPEQAHEHEFTKTSMFDWQNMRAMLEPAFPYVRRFSANMDMITQPLCLSVNAQNTAKNLLATLAGSLPNLRVLDLRGTNFRDIVKIGEAGAQALALTHIVESDLCFPQLNDLRVEVRPYELNSGAFTSFLANLRVHAPDLSHLGLEAKFDRSVEGRLCTLWEDCREALKGLESLHVGRTVCFLATGKHLASGTVRFNEKLLSTFIAAAKAVPNLFVSAELERLKSDCWRNIKEENNFLRRFLSASRKTPLNTMVLRKRYVSEHDMCGDPRPRLWCTSSNGWPSPTQA